LALTPAQSSFDAELPTKLSTKGLMPDEARRRDDQLRLLGIETVAGATNGRSHVVVGSAAPFLDRILLEHSIYYRLGVEAPTRSGDWMSLKVTSRRGGTSVRAASRIARPDVVTEPAPLATPDERLANMVRRGGLVRGLPVELATTLGRDPLGQRLQVTVNVRLREERRAPLQGLFVLIAEDGRIISNGRFPLLRRQIEPGSQAAFRVSVLPGRYLLRLGVADAQGEMGLAEQELIARLTQIGSYYASGLVVAWRGPEGQLRYPELDEVPPSAVSLHPVLELYAVEGRPTVVPEVRVEFEPAAGGAVISHDMAVTLAGTAAHARGEIPVLSLPPGEYILRARVFEQGRETGSVETKLKIAPPVSTP
jgi:hypothetical protein